MEDTIYRISATKLKTYLSCPYKFKLSYIDKLDTPSHPYFYLGSFVHKTIEKTLTSIKDDPDRREEFISCSVSLYDSIVEESLPNEDREDYAKYDKDGRKMVSSYDWPLEVPQVESYFNTSLDGVNFIGYIDQIFEDSAAVVDLKTGKRVPDMMVLQNDIQFTIYSMAIKEMYGYYPSAYWHHLRNGEKYQIYNPVSDKKRTFLMKGVESLFNSVNNNHYSRNVGFSCSFCDYRGVCLGDR